MFNVRKEFSHFDNFESFDKIFSVLKNYGFVDSSWHNDAMPSMTFEYGNNYELVIWVDFKDPDKSDFFELRKEGVFKEFFFGERNSDTHEYLEEYHYDDLTKLIEDVKKVLDITED